MDFEYSARCKDYLARVRAFMDEHVYPNEKTYHEQLAGFGTNRWQVLPIIEELKAKAKAEGLWNLFHPDAKHGAGLSNADYAPLAEEMGRVVWASEVFNCSAPDTGNMEVLSRYGTKEQQDKWLTPLLAGEIRSAFLMTEPAVASSDATNIECSIRRDGDANARQLYRGLRAAREANPRACQHLRRAAKLLRRAVEDELAMV